MMKRLMLLVAISLATLSGCVERALVITSDPSGAQVTVNQQWKGTTPFVVPFKHYGVYDIWIEHPGYEENGRMVKFYPMHVGEPVKAPGYQYAGADFVSEVLLPTTLQDQHNLHYVLERVDKADEISDVLTRAAELRTASQLRTEMRAEKDAARNRRSAEPTPAGDATPIEAESIDNTAPAAQDNTGPDYMNDPYIDATPPDPTDLPVFTN